MKTTARLTTMLAVAAALIALPTFALDLAQWTIVGDSIVATPHDGSLAYQLKVSAPNGDVFSQSFAAGEQPSFQALDNQGYSLGDGSYTAELVALPGQRDRSNGAVAAIEGRAQTHYFAMAGGAFLASEAEEVHTKDQQILDDLIVGGSACVGQDCNNGENFGFDTLRLKENNLRIKFDDTSNSASFPSNDWQLAANDTTNGGANKFSIDDVTNGRTPFTIEASAPSHSLYVDDGGRVGLGTSTPVVELHVTNGDSPTLRLEQDGSSGFTAQTWDVAGNETNFFVRDATNGSQLPFKIRPSAPTNALYIDTNGDIGLGDASPDAALDIESGDLMVTNGVVNVTKVSAGAAAVLLSLTNDGPAQFDMVNTNAGSSWKLNTAANGNFRFVEAGNGAIAFDLEAGGDLILGGSLFTATANSCNTGTPCDGVFDPSYDVGTIEEHAAAMWENSFLPAVGPTGPNQSINLTKKTLGMLNELEKAHIYIEQLNDNLKSKDDELDALKARMAALEAALGLASDDE